MAGSGERGQDYGRDFSPADARGRHLRDLVGRIPVPSLLRHVLDRVASSGGRSRDEVARTTTATAR